MFVKDFLVKYFDLLENSLKYSQSLIDFVC